MVAADNPGAFACTTIEAGSAPSTTVEVPSRPMSVWISRSNCKHTCMHSVRYHRPHCLWILNQHLPATHASTHCPKRNFSATHTIHLSLGGGADAKLGGLHEGAREAVVRRACGVGAVHRDVRAAVVRRLQVRQGNRSRGNPAESITSSLKASSLIPYQCRCGDACVLTKMRPPPDITAKVMLVPALGS